MMTKKGTLTGLSVLLIYLLNIEVSIVNTALGEITKAFPDTDPVIISLISTLPTLVMFIMSSLVGKLATKYDKRSLVLFALIIYIIGGLGGFFMSQNIYQVLFMRVLVGIGAGISAPLCGAIIAELYEGNKRATMLGLSNSFGSLMAVLMTMLGGWLCAMNWKYTFLAYGVFLFVIILEFIALPSLPPAKVDAAQEDQKEKYTSKQKIKLGLISVYTFCCLLFGVIFFLKLAIFMTEENLGGPIVIASCFSTITVAAFLSALIFGFITKILKRYTLALYSASTALAFFCLMNAQSTTMILLACALNGLGMGIFMPALQFKAINSGPKENACYATSIVLASMFFGNFMATFLEKVIGLFGNPESRTLFATSFGAFTLFTIIYVGWVLTQPEGESTYAEAN